MLNHRDDIMFTEFNMDTFVCTMFPIIKSCNTPISSCHSSYFDTLKKQLIFLRKEVSHLANNQITNRNCLFMSTLINLQANLGYKAFTEQYLLTSVRSCLYTEVLDDASQKRTSWPVKLRYIHRYFYFLKALKPMLPTSRKCQLLPEL